MLQKSIKNTVLLLLGFCLVFYVSIDFRNNYNEIISSFTSISVLSILFSIFLYFTSHFFRVLRLVILSSDSEISIKDLAFEQFKANGVNLIIPFRLGESYRVIAFKKFFGSYSRSLSILLCERILDISLITLILFFASYFSDVHFVFIRNIIYISVALMALLLIIYFVLDELISIIHKIFLGKKTNKTNLTIIKLTGTFIRVINQTKIIFKSKISSCFAITFIIWSMEILVFYVLFSHLEISKYIIIFLALSVALSSLLPSGPAGYGGVQLAFYLIGIAIGFNEIVLYSYAYNFFIFGSGIILSSALFFGAFLKTIKSRT
jgi:uncharacterized protein (TIRG00374 family)